MVLGSGVRSGRSLLCLWLLFPLASAFAPSAEAAKKPKPEAPALTQEYRHPAGAFSFRMPEGWEAAEKGPETTEAWGGDLGFRFVYRKGETGYDGLHANCMLERLAPEAETDPRVRYDYDFVGGVVLDRRALDSAFVVRYDKPVRGHRDWRQRNVTVVGGGHSLCVIAYAPAQLWRASPKAKAAMEAVLGSLVLK